MVCMSMWAKAHEQYMSATGVRQCLYQSTTAKPTILPFCHPVIHLPPIRAHPSRGTGPVQAPVVLNGFVLCILLIAYIFVIIIDFSIQV